MKVLIVGGGGREHALAWKCAQSRRVETVFVAPGNAGTENEAKVHNVDLAADDIEGLSRYAAETGVDLTIVGPEAPLVAGMVDTFASAGLRCFGPSRDAARLEGSKAFSKDFLARHRIPTAGYGVFSETGPAIDYIRTQGAPIVVKADGLAAGKGVIVAETEAEAIAAVEAMLADSRFGRAGNRVVIEACLRGEEASFIAMVDGTHVLPMATSQDHKARKEGDRGPNTGGMGAYSPAPVITRELHQRIMSEVMLPTVRGMAEDGHPYTGFLYAGVMIDPDGSPQVLEYNCRLGDPETQPILMRLKSDLIGLCEMALEGRLDQAVVEWDPRPALGVVMVAGGYPGSYRTGDPISGLDQGDAANCKIFHAGTMRRDREVVTNGGRVLCVTAVGDSVATAQTRAYESVRKVHWRHAGFRRDIGYRAVAREQSHPDT